MGIELEKLQQRHDAFQNAIVLFVLFCVGAGVGEWLEGRPVTSVYEAVGFVTVWFFVICAVIIVARFVAELIRNRPSAVLKEYERGYSAWQRGDYATAGPIMQRLADLGHVDAEFNLGVAYQLGRGLPRDLEQAIYWYRRAAIAGNVDARYNLGLLYLGGDGMPTHLVQAYGWLFLAGDQYKNLKPEMYEKTRKTIQQIKERMTPEEIDASEKWLTQWAS